VSYQVVVPDNVDQAAIDLLEGAAGITCVAPGKVPREELLALAPQADGFVIRSGVKVDGEVLALAARLKCIARAGVGVDNVDLPEATRRGVVVMNTPGGNTIATAEQAFALMLALARHTPQAHQSVAEGRWDRKAFVGTELYGKTLGLLGFGRVGAAVAARALGFGMAVLAYDPFFNDAMRAVAAELGVKEVGLDDLCAQADYISLHAALTDDSREMVNRALIARMKPGVRIVNAARGALIDDADLAEAIQSGQVAGAAVDVYAQEPPPADHPLIGLPGVIHTPHLGASTVEAQVAVAVQAAQQVIDGLLKGEYRNVVNPDVLEESAAG
jgi:D-3-phosphoglycerate dehydrogenase